MTRTIFLFIFLAFLSGYAAARAAESVSTGIVADEKAGVVHVIVNGKTILSVKPDGIHVTGDVVYTGVIIDRPEEEQP